MKISLVVIVALGIIALNGCASTGSSGGGAPSPEPMCTYAGLENVPASSPNCVAPPPPPPPAICQYDPNLTATDPACVPPRIVLDTIRLSAPIYFGPGQAGITAGAAKTLSEKVAWLQANPGLRIRIEGNAEDLGSERANLQLSERRTAAAKAYLLRSGIAANRVDIVGYGRERPVCTEKTEACRRQNRRADFRIVTLGSGNLSLPGGANLAQLDTFPWPPPNPSKWAMIPPMLCNNPAQPTIGGSWQLVRDAFRRGGFPETERSFLIPPDGFAMVGQMEAIDKEARFKPGDDRWQTPETPRIASSSLSEWIADYVNDIFGMGRYRVIVIAVTNRPSRGPGPASEMIRTLITTGTPGRLPDVIEALPLPTYTGCFALVYEFERPADPKRTRVVTVTRAQAMQHLILAQLWTAQQLRIP